VFERLEESLHFLRQGSRKTPVKKNDQIPKSTKQFLFPFQIRIHIGSSYPFRHFTISIYFVAQNLPNPFFQ
jgi:hypothetical protein